MNNHRLLTGLLAASLWSWGVRAMAGNRQVLTMEELFAFAEQHSAQLRPSFTAEEVARREISVAKSGYLPDIEANLSFSYIGDGFTTKRNLSDYQKAAIPHFGNNFGIDISQPVYTGGAVKAGIELAKLKTTAARYSTEQQRDNIRFRLAGFYLDIYKTPLTNIGERRLSWLRIHIRHVRLAQMEIQDHDSHCVLADYPIPDVFLFLHRLWRGEGDAFHSPLLPGSGGGDNINRFPDIHCSERTAVSGIPSGIDNQRIHRRRDERYIRTGRNRGMAETCYGRECLDTEFPVDRFQQCPGRHSDSRAVRHGAGQGIGCIDEGDLWMAAHSGIIFSIDNPAKL